MAVAVVTPPESEPVTLEVLTEFLRIDAADRDQVLEALIVAAREYAEGRTARALITQTLALVLDAFPRGAINLPRPPLQEVTAVRYRNDAGEEVTIDPAAYVVDTSSEPGRIAPAPGHSWPAAALVPGSVRIEFRAGYGDGPDDVPQSIRIAMQMHIAAWHEHPEAVSKGELKEVPFAAGVLLDQAKAYGWIG